MPDEPGEFLSSIERLNKLEKTVVNLDNRVLKMEILTQVLRETDIDALARLVIRLKAVLMHRDTVAALIRARDSIILPPVPPPGLPDLMHYYEAAGKQEAHNQAIAELNMRLDRFIGKLENSEHPWQVAQDWYSQAQHYLRGRDFVAEIFTEPPEHVFPVPSPTTNDEIGKETD